MIIKKIISFLFVFAFMLAISGFTAQEVQAATFPSGCASAIGYSITDGEPCNGTSTATSLAAGCSTPIGYSTTNGVPCSGDSEAISFLSGCTSLFGYSTITASPCNGTNTATSSATVTNNSTTTVTTVTPGLPTTGVASITPISATLLSLFGLLFISGVVYAVRKIKLA